MVISQSRKTSRFSEGKPRLRLLAKASPAQRGSGNCPPARHWPRDRCRKWEGRDNPWRPERRVTTLTGMFPSMSNLIGPHHHLAASSSGSRPGTIKGKSQAQSGADVKRSMGDIPCLSSLNLFLVETAVPLLRVDCPRCRVWDPSPRRSIKSHNRFSLTLANQAVVVMGWDGGGVATID